MFETCLWIESKGFEQETCPMGKGGSQKIGDFEVTMAHAFPMLPIGDRFTMGPKEAAYAIRLLGVKHVIPMHYGTFDFLTGTVEALRVERKRSKG